MAIVPDGVHPGIKPVKNLVRVVFWGMIWNPLGVVLAKWGSVRGGDKCGKLYVVETTLEGCRSLNTFFTRLGVTTEFCPPRQ